MPTKPGPPEAPKGWPLGALIWSHYVLMLLPTVVLIGLAVESRSWVILGLVLAFCVIVAAIKYKLSRDIERDKERLLAQVRIFTRGERIEPLHTAFREINEISAAFVEASRARLLVMDELRHRGRNMLTKVQMLVTKAIQSSVSTEDASRRVFDLMQTLNRIDNLLVRHDMRGASLREVFEQELELYRSESHTAELNGEDLSLNLDFESYRRNDHAIELSGEDLPLDRQTAEPLGLLAHELATNALKYGALRPGRGRIDVSWAIAEGHCTLRWIESGGPPFGSAPALGTGFGSKLLENTVHALGGTYQRTLEPGGLKLIIRFPCRAVS